MTTTRIPRPLHPGAWWLWAIGMAVAASRTTNPMLLGVLLAATTLVVVSRRDDSPWARAYPLYLLLGVVIIGVRVVLHVLVGFKYGEHTLVHLPEVSLPSWAAGIELGGTVRLEGLLDAVLQGLRLAILIACIGAANALANPKRLLRALPGALHEVGVAVVVSISLLPQLADSIQRVRRAHRLRGARTRGIRGLRRVALPVLADALDRSILLAAAMDSRGYGRRAHVTTRWRHGTGALLLASLVALCLGTYGLLDGATTSPRGLPALAAGVALAGAGLWAGGRAVHRTRYRPDPWHTAEWAVVASGVTCAVCLVITGTIDPVSLTMPLQPLAAPALPLLSTAGILVGGTASFLAPAAPRQLTSTRTRPARGPSARSSSARSSSARLSRGADPAPSRSPSVPEVTATTPTTEVHR